MIYEFSDLTLDLDRHLLTRGGQPIKLTKLSFKALQALVQAAPALITHDDLIEQVWGPNRVITPDNLSQRMKTLRHSLGDDPNHPVYIEGIRGEGYRLVPEVKIQSSQIPGRPSGRTTGKTPSSRLIFSLVVMVVALGYIAFDKFVSDTVEDDQMTQSAPGESQPAALPESLGANSIAVLPFDNRSTREEDLFFTEGIHDDLLATIAKIGSMKVISRTSVMEYTGTNKKIPQIAQELGVAHILEGGVQRSGDQVRINVQLIDATTDEHLWAEIYDRELTTENLFAVQSEITKKIADALQAELSTDEQLRIEARPTDNLQAYELYLRGRYLWQRRGEQNIRHAIALFEQATELDPQFARAWSSLAATRFTLPVYSDSPSSEHYPLAVTAARKALALDDSLAEAYAVLGGLADMDGKWGEANTLFLLAIANEPTDSTAHLWYSEHLFKLGRLDDALEETLIAYQIDPLHPGTNALLGWIYFYQNDSSNALKFGAAAWDLGHDSGLYFQAWMYLHIGEYDRAVAFAVQWDERDAEQIDSPQIPLTLRQLIEANDDALLEPLFPDISAEDKSFESFLILLTAYVRFDQIDEAYRIVNTNLDVQGFLGYLVWPFWQFDMAPFRQDPRFAVLVTDLGMVDYWREYGWPDFCRQEGDKVICQ